MTHRLAYGTQGSQQVSARTSNRAPCGSAVAQPVRNQFAPRRGSVCVSAVIGVVAATIVVGFLDAPGLHIHVLAVVAAPSPR
jgi:hypothetical protein